MIMLKNYLKIMIMTVIKVKLECVVLKSTNYFLKNKLNYYQD